jgi:hypothetical protein
MVMTQTPERQEQERLARVIADGITRLCRPFHEVTSERVVMRLVLPAGLLDDDEGDGDGDA